MKLNRELSFNIGIILLFVVGIVLRLFFYIKNQSLWFDEAGLAMNFITKTYSELFNGLDYLQAAPAGFCILSKFMIDVFDFNSDVWRDYILKLIPLISGILFLPFFYYLAKLVLKEKGAILISFAIVALNMHAILYSSQCKQYSTELLISTILIIIFYKMYSGVRKPYYPIIIAISPWFSYSSFFVLLAGLIGLFIKQKRAFYINLTVILISSFIYYLVSLKSVFGTNYSGMNTIWDGLFKAFIDIHHPIRALIRFGELTILIKVWALISGLIMFVSLIKFGFSKNDIGLKLLFIFTPALVIFASVMHQYPVYSRLILFLLPIFAITISCMNGKFFIFVKDLYLFILLIALLNSSIYAKSIAYSYAREAVCNISENITPGDKFIMDNDATEFYFYMKNKNLKNEIIKMPVSCLGEDIKVCENLITNLPDGKYYFLSSHFEFVDYLIKEKGVINNFSLDNFKPKYNKVLYFNKRGAL